MSKPNSGDEPLEHLTKEISKLSNRVSDLVRVIENLDSTLTDVNEKLKKILDGNSTSENLSGE